MLLATKLWGDPIETSIDLSLFSESEAKTIEKKSPAGVSWWSKQGENENCRDVFTILASFDEYYLRGFLLGVHPTFDVCFRLAAQSA